MDGKARLILVTTMTAMMVLMVTLIATFINIGPRHDFVLQWMKAYVIGWPVAAVTGYLIMNGIKCATACFITRADFTTCGKNILPAPNRSPTTCIPAINGPSMIDKQRS